MTNRELMLVMAFSMLVPLAACRDGIASSAKEKDECATCGVVESVVTREVKGEGTGKGAVAGAIVGGVVGHQFGSGKGNDAATVVGAGAGAVAGHEIEKEMNSRLVYEVTVRMEKDGVRRLVVLDVPPDLRQGDKVKVTQNRIERL